MTDPRPYHFAVEDHTLGNGLRVLLMERRRLPIVSLTLMVKAGVISEGPREQGLAGFTAGMLPRGTDRRGAVRLAEDVDSLGAVLGVHADYDYSMVGISSLARDTLDAVGILAEVVSSPAFAPEEVERRRNDNLSQLERLKDDPVDLVRNRFLERIYGAHPYHHPAAGIRETVARFQSEDVRGFYSRLYRPNNSILAMVGDLDPKTTLRMLEDAFACWGRAGFPSPGLPPIPEREALTVDRIQKDGMTQATIRVGSIGIRRDSPDYVPLVLLNHVLGGGGFGSRLMKSLREESGLTYGAYSNFHPRREPGYFFASCQTGIATMNETLEKMVAEIRLLRDEGVREEELEWARRFFSGSLPLSLQTNDQLANRVLEQVFFGLEEEFWLKDVERMQAVGLEEVDAAARLYLHPERLAVVCLADFTKGELVVKGETAS